jgi:exodeoxyribonuclease VII large subunit
MMDLLDDDDPADTGANTSNAHEFTVAELSGAVKRMLEGEFGRIRVRGEIGRVIRARSGHVYYDIKDDRNTLACTTWKGQAARLSVQPEEGLEVIVTGRLTAYGAQSKYNMNVEEIEVAGAGALMAMLDKRKRALTAEGLFALERKKPLPYLPQVIGVITSPTGAVIRDILHRLRDRFPRHVLIWPVAVQGKACAPEVTRAIEGFNALPVNGPIPRPDLLIVARGGGSLEDLWGFNEESVVRAAADSRIPLISAVGHETDTTLIDYAADRRAPTPTAAAEMAVPVRLDLLAGVQDRGARMTNALRGALRARDQRLRDLARALPRADSLLAPARQRLDLAAERLPNALRGVTTARRLQLSRLEGRGGAQALRTQITQHRTRLSDLARRLDAGPTRAMTEARRDLARLSARLTPAPLTRTIRDRRTTLTATLARLRPVARARTTALRARLDGLERMRLSLGYEETLKRGYAVVWDGPTLITNTKAVAAAHSLEVQFADGRVPVGTGAPAPKPKSKTPPEPKGGQGSLF